MASERTTAEEVKIRRASYLHLNIWLQKCGWVKDCPKKLTWDLLSSPCCHGEVFSGDHISSREPALTRGVNKDENVKLLIKHQSGDISASPSLGAKK